MVQADPYLRIMVVKLIDGEIAAISLSTNALPGVELGQKHTVYQSGDVTVYETTTPAGAKIAHMYATSDESGDGVDSVLDIVRQSGAVRLHKAILELIGIAQSDVDESITPVANKTPVEPYELPLLADMWTMAQAMDAIQRENDDEDDAAIRANESDDES